MNVWISLRLGWFSGVIAGLTIGCGPPSEQQVAERLKKHARVQVRQEVLDTYAGTYVFPSGALFHVSRQGERLLAGTPPYELLAQTTREFASNRLPAVITFERDEHGRVSRLNYRLAKRDLGLPRLGATQAVDPTQMIDVGQHRLRLLVRGQGAPTVVIEDGFGSSIEMRCEMQARLSDFVRVVTYDHGGTGGSEPGPDPRDAATIATELRRALEKAELSPPFLLVGGSIGGDYIRVFADRYPADVFGLVLLDPAPDWEALQTWLQMHSPGDVPSIDQIHQLSDAAGSAAMKYQESGRQSEWAALGATRRQARNAFPPPRIAVTQIIGVAGQKTRHLARLKIQFFEDWLQQHIPHGRQVLALESRHAIFASEPQLVMDEIHRLVTAYRQRETALLAPGR